MSIFAQTIGFCGSSRSPIKSARQTRPIRNWYACRLASTSILADQVIGFKVGAAAWNVTDDTIPYSYNASAAFAATPPGYNNEFWLIRSVQISLIARTTPVTDPTYTYRNGFDSGPYQIESVMVVVNPRNMTMNNN